MTNFSFAPPARAVHSLFFHCSASDRPEHDDVSVMRDWHVNGNGWSDVGYHYFVKKSGAWQAGRPLEKTPAAQGEGFNSGTIAVCLHGLAKAAFTSEQFRTGYAMVRAICDAYGERGVQIRVRGHCEVYPKECPVFDYRRAFGLDAAGHPTQQPDFAVQSAAPRVLAKPLDLYMMVPGNADKVKRLQESLTARGFPCGEIDGIFGRKTHDALVAWQLDTSRQLTGVADRAVRLALGIES